MFSDMLSCASKVSDWLVIIKWGNLEKCTVSGDRTWQKFFFEGLYDTHGEERHSLGEAADLPTAAEGTVYQRFKIINK